MTLLLAVDAGGTSTRAAIFDRSGACLGFGRARGGNPTAAGIVDAVTQIALAVEVASGTAGGAERGSATSAVIALAGEETVAFRDAVSVRLASLGVVEVAVLPDLLGMFHSGTPALDGYVLIAGTGAVAARVVDGRLDRVAGGAGWLLGDAGSGFWIGRRVARAVVADLDGRADPTRLTGLLLDELGVEKDGRLDHGSPRTLRRLVSLLYAMRPVELARFAPLAFAARDDATARRIVAEASAALEALLRAVRSADVPLAPGSPPVVLGGSILIEGMRVGRDPDAVGGTPPFGGIPTVPVSDGLVGAAVLALRASGTVVDDDVFDRLRTSLAAHRH